MKKLNNKGFSLVELIIVIAIMAILVGVVGTQVIPYLENSRKAKDIQILSAWNTAAMSAYSAAAAKIDSESNYKLVVTNGAVTPSTTGGTGKGSDVITRNFCDLTGMSEATEGTVTGGYDFSKMESKAGKLITSVEILIQSTGEITTEAKLNKDDPNYKKTYEFDIIENK